ncbi:hypothetical protein [Thalassococcus sp. S3]|uniref:hypothetical protein n=1 Tax=Thalassococcus sp. S3 TaxID=2017482 RepID=UPI0010242018|nr:hypothetical protein [Thalassococcus sp. S3]QBF31500.1 hypothetical protein CFI11_09765 [Thalassococcus sp. S3]
MTALTEDRNTPEALGPMRVGPAKSDAVVYVGALVMRNANGFLTEGASQPGMVGVGRSEERVNNTGGANGDVTVKYKPGTFRYANSAGGDEITTAHVGDLVYIVDDQTVALTDDAGSRSPAGFVDMVDSLGVWVRFDEALALAASA